MPASSGPPSPAEYRQRAANIRRHAETAVLEETRDLMLMAAQECEKFAKYAVSRRPRLIDGGDGEIA